LFLFTLSTEPFITFTAVTYDMSGCETRIPVSKDTRKQLRFVKAEEEKHSYDDAIRHLLDRRKDGV